MIICHPQFTILIYLGCFVVAKVYFLSFVLSKNQILELVSQKPKLLAIKHFVISTFLTDLLRALFGTLMAQVKPGDN